MNWLRNFMAGRYGVDQLSLAMLVAYVLMSLVASMADFQIFNVVALLLLVICWFRMMSRNTWKRSAENQKFLTMTAPVRGWFGRVMTRLKDRNHRYFQCSGCRTTLRVPRGRGKIEITCPHCGRRVVKKS
ncbi:MAG: hypothetical protein RR135_05980 [Oscillospiraceae bacterium]